MGNRRSLAERRKDTNRRYYENRKAREQGQTEDSNPLDAFSW